MIRFIFGAREVGRPRRFSRPADAVTRPTRMCIMLPTLTWGELDYRFRESVAKTPLLSVALPSILDTTDDNDGVQYLLLIGHNPEDAVFGYEHLGSTVGARKLAIEIVSELVGNRKNIHVLLRTIYGTTGTTVLWNALALWGFDIGCDYFVPANDDLLWVSSGWANLAIQELRNKTEPCPNFGIVALSDGNAFKVDFPTFHIVSRLHMYIHKRTYYPVVMRGWGVDPWIYYSYVAVGAGTLNHNIKVLNRVQEYDRVNKKVIKLLPLSLERYDGDPTHSLQWQNYSVNEVAFLRSWMTDEQSICCDSIECTEQQVGSSLILPVVSVFR